MICKNCHAAFEGHFCCTCGQKAETHRITLSHIVHEFFHAFTHADKGVLFLMKELVTKPGIVAREYVEGKRKKYFNPLSFLVLTSAIHFYLVTITGYYHNSSNTQGARVRYPMNEVFEIIDHHGKLLELFLLVPLISIIGWLFFRRPKYNLAEHFVLQSFVLGQGLNIRSLIFIPLFVLFPKYHSINLAIYQATLLSYMIFANKQFFGQHIIITILKTALIMVLFITLFWACILGFVYVRHLIVET
jgi:hypothetical protein